MKHQRTEVRVQGKRIFVTGGASGLGRAIAARFGRAGFKICIGDVNEERGEETRAALASFASDVLFVRCDVTREEDLAAVKDTLVARWGGVDIVVNNAGVAQAGPIDDVSLADWEWITNINLFGVVRGCKVFTPVFKRQGHGRFVNVASMAGLLDVPSMGAYNATKAAVVSLSETLENELASSNVRVHVVCPSFFKTNLGESLRASDPKLRARMDALLDRSTVTADDVAEAVFVAVRDEEFYVLPHVDGRKVWFMKRYLPRPLYRKMFAKAALRAREKQEASEGER
jgi:NAD(P)-dependent dehydrogenase (short-subunit alcohol dehydrogenase family)